MWLNFASDLAEVGGSKEHRLLEHFSSKNNPVECFLRDYCFVIKKTVIGIHIRPEGPSPLNSKIYSMSIPLTVANFFQKYFVA